MLDLYALLIGFVSRLNFLLGRVKLCAVGLERIWVITP